MSDFKLLPPHINLETNRILKKTAQAHRYLGELKGVLNIIPNKEILLNTLSLQEAKLSSEIENIVTTQDELFKNEINSDYIKNPATKEVENYAFALKKGFEIVKNSELPQDTSPKNSELPQDTSPRLINKHTKSIG
jgi:cell filamentation protein, protein adenylyltransferase